VARPNLFQFGLNKMQIFAHSALSTAVENDTIDEEDAPRHCTGQTGELVCILGVARPNLFQFGLNKMRIFAHSALSTAVENGTIGEEDAPRHCTGRTGELVCILGVSGKAKSLPV